MKSFPNQESIVKAILNGIQTAKTNYTFWTADQLYLSYASENFLTIHIAQEIAKIENPPEIFLDATVADILRCSLPNRSDFKEFMYEKKISQGTFSLTLDTRMEHISDNDSISKAIISVHNGVRNAKEEYQNEIHRLCKMLDYPEKKYSTLEFGVFAFYLDISSSARKKSQKRIEEIVSKFDSIVQEYDNIQSTFKGGEIETIQNIGEWSVGCYIIEPK